MLAGAPAGEADDARAVAGLKAIGGAVGI